MTRALVITMSVAVLCIALTDNVWAHPPWGIAVDQQGQVYFSDLETIWKIDAQGRQTVFRAGVSGRHTHELTIDDEGNLYGEDLTYEPATQRYISAIWKMTPAGGFSYLLAPTRSAPKGMSIWRDRDGNTYYLQNDNPNHEIVLLKRSSDGNITPLLGSREAADRERQIVLYSMGGMAFSADGVLYLTDGENIYKVTTSGVVTTLVRNLAAESSSGNETGGNLTTRLLGLTVDSQSNVFAADLGKGRVVKITPNGSVTTLVQAERSLPPTGVAFKNGALYILEFGAADRSRVRKLSSDGKVSVLATIGEGSNPPVTEARNNQTTGSIAAPNRFALYALLGGGAGLLVLTVIWLVRRKALPRRQQN